MWQEPRVQIMLVQTSREKKAGAVRKVRAPALSTCPGLGKQCANVGSSRGVPALLKRHFGLAIEVGRQGQEQAGQRRKSLLAEWLFPTPYLSTPLLVTLRKATLLLIQFQ